MEYDDDHVEDGRFALDDSLKPYMAYSRDLGASEGAVLTFAHTVREAKIVAWSLVRNMDIVEEWTDLAVNRLKDIHIYSEADQEKLLSGTPHVIESPRTCVVCHLWGEPINEDGVCESCYEDEEADKETALL